MSDLRTHALAALILCLPALACAWYPSDPYPMAGPSGHLPGYSPPPVYGDPPDPGFGPDPRAPWPAAPAWGESGATNRDPLAGPPPSPAFPTPPPSGAGSLRISRELSDDAYLIRIAVGDGKTSEVQVSPAGRGLAISRTNETQTRQEDTLDDGRGYRQSYSFSRGSMSRRLGLPPDADLSRMTREDLEGTILLSIPRIAAPMPTN